jgi:hypothetical protein
LEKDDAVGLEFFASLRGVAARDFASRVDHSMRGDMGVVAGRHRPAHLACFARCAEHSGYGAVGDHASLRDLPHQRINAFSERGHRAEA